MTTVCLDRVPDEPTEVILGNDNTFIVETQPSVLISPPDHVEVISSLGGCAQRAVPFGNNSTHC